MLVSLIPADIAYAMKEEEKKLEVVHLSDGQYMIKLPGIDYTRARQVPDLPKINPEDNPDEFWPNEVKVDIDDLVLQATGVKSVTITVTATDADYSRDYKIGSEWFGKGYPVPVPNDEYSPKVFVKFDDGRDSRYIVEAKSKPTNVVNINIGFLGHTGVATRWFGSSTRPDVKANFVGINETPHKFDLPKIDQNSILREGNNPWAWRGHDNPVNLQIVPESHIRINDFPSTQDIYLKIQDAKHGKLADSKYYYQIIGDSLHGFHATMREETKVIFDANGAKYNDETTKKENKFANGLKVGDKNFSEFHTFKGDERDKLIEGSIESVGIDGLKKLEVPTAKDINKDSIPKKTEDGKQVEQEFQGWSRSANGPVIKNFDNEVIEGDTTFYAIYAPIAQGKVAVQYVDANGNAIEDKYKIQGKDYPKFADGNMGEDVKKDTIPEPKFIGYERSGDIVVTGKKYDENGRDTVEVPYKKLPDIIPGDEASEDVKNTYTKVTFAADTNKGKLKLGETDGGAEKVYYVNPKSGKTIEDVRTKDNITAEGKKDVYKVDETTPWTFGLKAGKDKSSLTEIKEHTINDTSQVVVNQTDNEGNDLFTEIILTANFVKEKGTVTYVYDYKNETSITDPSKTDIPAVPTDNKEHEVETTVTAETTIAKDKTVPVKDNNGNTIGNWKFSGWNPAELKVKKNSDTVKNEFKGTWTFEEVGKKDVTYEFASGTSGATLPEDVTKLLKLKTKTGQYIGSPVTAPTEAYNSVKIEEGTNAGTWTFKGWYAKSIDDEANKNQTLIVSEEDPNKFIGKWEFEKAKSTVSYKFEYEPADTTASKNGITTELTDNKEYEVGTPVTPKTIEKTNVEVKDDQGNVIGVWTFNGWNKENLTVDVDKANNVFTGKWIFAEKLVMSHKFKVEGTNNVPDEVKAQLPKDAYIAKGSDYSPKNPENIVVKNIKDKTDEKIYDYTFEGWNPKKVDKAQENKEFEGTWTRKQSVSDKPIVNEPKKGDKVITGKGEPESVIEVEIPNPKDPTNPKKVTTTVGNDGKWTVDIPEAKEGDEYNVTQTEKGKTPSEKVTVKVKDKVKPEPKPEPKPVPEVEIPGIKYKDHYTPTYPVYVSVPDKKEPVQDIFTHEQYIFGYPDDTIRPDGDMTRAEAIAVVARLQKLDLSDKTSNIYKDTKAGMWYNAAINAAFREGYLLEKEGENIRPNDKITRAELALLISHIDKKNDTVAPFEDVKGHKFEAAINQAYGNERIKGYPDGTFKPDNSITRAEVATMLNKLYDRYPDKNYIDANQNLVHNYKDMSYKGHWGYYELVEAYHTHKFARLANNMEEWKAIIK